MIALQNLFRNHNSKTNYSWEQYQEPMEEFLQALDDFVENGYLRNKSLHFLNTFLNDILPILIELTRSHCKIDWDLLVSAVRRVCRFSLTLTAYIKEDGVHCILNIVGQRKVSIQIFLVVSSKKVLL